MPRPLTIVADDYGIGRETSRGILELACERRVTGVVLLVNTPDAETAAREWLAARPDADLGWHPNLTLDRPLLPASRVPSLTRPDGRFWPLASFLRRLAFGRIRSEDVRAEWRAQHERFVELLGHPPALVNSHQHVSLFPPCAAALEDVLPTRRPYVRRVVESRRTLLRVPGARLKRVMLNALGRRQSTRRPGCDRLVGVTNAECVGHPSFLTDWLESSGDSRSVEVCTHPGHRDPTLLGRDCSREVDLARRPAEMALLRDPAFASTCRRLGFRTVRPSEVR